MSGYHSVKLSSTGSVDGSWRVLFDGEPLDPAPSLAVINHSPTGFAWGYGGSGPSQLALAIMLASGVPEDVAVRLHCEYRDATVAGWRDGETHYVDVQDWLRGREMSLRPRPGETPEEVLARVTAAAKGSS